MFGVKCMVWWFEVYDFFWFEELILLENFIDMVEVVWFILIFVVVGECLCIKYEFVCMIEICVVLIL